MSIPKPKPADCFRYSADQNSGGCHGSTAVLVSYYAGGLGAGVAASIVRARGPSRMWKDAWLCHDAAYVSCALVMVSLGVPSAFALTYSLVPSLLYGSAALVFARNI